MEKTGDRGRKDEEEMKQEYKGNNDKSIMKQEK